MEMPVKQKINDIEYDIFHSILLSHYIKHWGIPEYKTKVSKNEDIPISAFCFSDSPNNSEVLYFATIGVSWQKKLNGKYQGQEFYMVVPKVKEIGINDTLNYLIDISVHNIHNPLNVEIPSIMQSLVCPKIWTAKDILFDQPLGEPESFTTVEHTLKHTTELIWTIPLRNDEFKFISKFGIEKFDEKVKKSDESLINPFRNSILL